VNFQRERRGCEFFGEKGRGRIKGDVNFQRGWVVVNEREEGCVKRVVDRSLNLKHASMGESLQRLYFEG
jgi:hypothetical protein